jgi:hypothetical protein
MRRRQETRDNLMALMDEEYRRRLEVERNKRLPPGSPWHSYWCAIFQGQGKKCDCDDGRKRRTGYRPLKGGGGEAAPTNKKQKALAVRKQRALEGA